MRDTETIQAELESAIADWDNCQRAQEEVGATFSNAHAQADAADEIAALKQELAQSKGEA